MTRKNILTILFKDYYQLFITELIFSNICNYIFATLYGILEFHLITKNWEAVCVDNILCKLMFWKFYLYHITLFMTVLVVVLPPVLDELILIKKLRKYALLHIFTVLYNCLVIEDLSWHVNAWLTGELKIFQFCKWTLEPFTQIPIPWWYLFSIPLTTIYVLKINDLFLEKVTIIIKAQTEKIKHVKP